jgi:YD repeat-containing protein
VTRGNGVVSSYQYDPLGRLGQLDHNMAGTTHDVVTGFTYNTANQIASSTRSNDVYAWNGHGNVDRSYTVNGLNQLTGSSTTAAGSATAMGYDGRGNLTGLGPVAYGYTSENRLASGNGWSFGYDGVGRLFYSTMGGGLYREYAGQYAIAEYGIGGAPRLRRYVYGPGADTPLVWYEGSSTPRRAWVHHCDHQCEWCCEPLWRVGRH